MRYSTGTKAFKWEGVPEMRKVFATLAEAIGPDGMGTARAQLKDAFMVPALTIRDEARDLAPIRAEAAPHGEPPGTLRNALYVTRGPDDRPGVVVAVDLSKAPYGGYVERGTSKTPAQPFFRPAVAATRPLVANMIADGLKKTIESLATQLGYHPSS